MKNENQFKRFLEVLSHQDTMSELLAEDFPAGIARTAARAIVKARETVAREIAECSRE